jgi:3-methyladenine DNA glycosylase AlkD
MERRGTRKGREGLARFGISASKVFGVPSVGMLRTYGKKLGPDHALADALMESGWYEARLLAAFVAEPDKLTAAQMNRWISRCENWGDVDTLCFVAFDRSALAWGRLPIWATRKGEFEKRAAFALLASLALHAKSAPDVKFVAALPLIERAAADPRNFVKKGVSWALRAYARRGAAVRAAALVVANTLARSDDATKRWVGRDGLRDLGKVSKRQEKR